MERANKPPANLVDQWSSEPMVFEQLSEHFLTLLCNHLLSSGVHRLSEERALTVQNI